MPKVDFVAHFDCAGLGFTFDLQDDDALVLVVFLVFWSLVVVWPPDDEGGSLEEVRASSGAR